MEKMPRIRVTSLAVNANDRDSGGGSQLGLEFAPAHRARRIRHLLEEHGPGLDADAMERIHTDTHLGSWPALRALLQETVSLSDAALALRERLLSWDGQMDGNSSDAGAFAAWRSALVLALARIPKLRPLTQPHGHSPLFGPWLYAASRIGFALETLIADGPAAGLDVVEAAREALEEVAAAVMAETWGSSHTVLPLHALDDHGFRGLAPAVPVTPLSGDTGCVLSTESLPGVTDSSFRGPVARYVWDLADRAASRWIVPFGSSGHPKDPDFASQLPLWAAGELIPVITDWEKLTKENHDPR
jgi:penicillin amidase